MSQRSKQSTSLNKVIPFVISFVTSTTSKREDNLFHNPVVGSSILIRTRSKLLGSRVGYWSDGNETDSTWYENDGVVNTVSMYGPSTGINGLDPIVEYDNSELLIPGQWYWIKLSNMDHWSIIGHLGGGGRLNRAQKELEEHMVRLKKLPL